jgi:hypothetical protein
LTRIGRMRHGPLGIVDAMLLEDFGNDWNSRVDWVRNHKHESLGRDGGNSGGEIADNSGIDLSVGQRGGASVSSRVFYVPFRSRTEETDKP